MNNDLRLEELGGRVTLVKQFVVGDVGYIWIATDREGKWGMGKTVGEAVTELHERPITDLSDLPAASGFTN